MAEQPQKSITQCLSEFLTTKGKKEATLSDIYVAVRAVLGEKMPDSSIRATLYRKLTGKKSAYKPAFERYWLFRYLMSASIHEPFQLVPHESASYSRG